LNHKELQQGQRLRNSIFENSKHYYVFQHFKSTIYSTYLHTIDIILKSIHIAQSFQQLHKSSSDAKHNHHSYQEIISQLDQLENHTGEFENFKMIPHLMNDVHKLESECHSIQKQTEYKLLSDFLKSKLDSKLSQHSHDY
jgi:hypothetical protein